MNTPDAPVPGLDQAQADRLFLEHIVPIVLDGHSPSTQPTAIILTGERGSDVNALSAHLLNDFDEPNNVVRVDLDSLLNLYPGIEELRRGDPVNTDNLAWSTAQYWYDRTIEYAVNHRFDIIVGHDPHGHIDATTLVDRIATRSDTARATHRIGAAVMATAPAINALGRVNHFQILKEKTGIDCLGPNEVDPNGLLRVTERLYAPPTCP